MIYIVTGPPAAGKSTWVLARARPVDIVIDYDRLAVALTGHGGDSHDHAPAVAAVTKAARTAAIQAAYRQANTTDVYIIHSSPGQQRIAEYQAIGAQIITIDPGRDVVRQRAKSERPARMFAVIDAWYAGQSDGDHVERARVVRGAPKGRGSTTARGYGWAHQQARAKAIRNMHDGDPCSRCGGPMYRSEAKSLQLDHTDDRAAYRGLAHALCNLQAGQAKAMASRAKPTRMINSHSW